MDVAGAMITLFCSTTAFMCIGHFVADYPLQGDWLSNAKNPTKTLVEGERIWPLALVGHAAIHAGAVRLITGSWILAACELVAHATTDYFKCVGAFGYNPDQAIHLLCKPLWAAALVAMLITFGAIA